MATAAQEYLEPLTPDNAAVLFIDNQSRLILGVQSIDHTVLHTNTVGIAKLAQIYDIPAVLTTSGPQDGGSGPLVPGITETFPNIPVFERMEHLNAMDDERFASAVRATGRKKLILTGITTDFCLVWPAMSLIREGYHVFVAVDAAGSWTKQIDEAAIGRLVQMGATTTNVQAIAGELQNALSLTDSAAAYAKYGPLGEWLTRYTPAPSLIQMGAPEPRPAA